MRFFCHIIARKKRLMHQLKKLKSRLAKGPNHLIEAEQQRVWKGYELVIFKKKSRGFKNLIVNG